MSENIPFEIFVKFPKNASDLNLYFSVSDIMGRISRNLHGIQATKKLIIKWTIQMEWIFNQFITTQYNDKLKQNFILFSNKY